MVRESRGATEPRRPEENRHAATEAHRAELRDCARAASLVKTGALLWIVATVVIAFLADALTIDFVPIILLLMVPAIRDGSVSAITGTLLILGMYLATAGLIGGVLVFDPERLKMSGRALDPHWRPYMAVLVLCVAGWAGAGCWFALKARTAAVRMRRRSASLCVHCGYDLTGNESGACPECGCAVNAGTGHER